jgi:hypothetical protein
LRMARTMIRIVGGQAPAILSPTVGSSVRISVCPVIEGPTGRIEFVGAHPVAVAAAALAAVLRDRGGWPPPAVHPGLSCLSRLPLATLSACYVTSVTLKVGTVFSRLGNRPFLPRHTRQTACTSTFTCRPAQC